MVCIGSGFPYTLAQPVAAGAGVHTPHVLLITIDGFPAELLNDVHASIPTIRQLVKEGTVSEGMRVINPAITWPNHTTLITGVRADRHGVMFNGVLERGGAGKPVKVDPNRDQNELVAVPTLFDVAHRAGLRTANINWPCTRGSKSIDVNFPDVPKQIEFMTPKLREQLLADGILVDTTDKTFMAMGSVRRDEVWCAAACQVIREFKPDFLTYHILNLDAMHHADGPGSPAGYTAMALADAEVRQVLEALDAAGIRRDTTIFVVADHGFAKAGKLILPNVVFRQNKLLTAGPTSIVAARAQAITEGGTAMVYLTDPATLEEDRRRVMGLMKGIEGVADVVEPSGHAELAISTPSQNRHAPDLVLVAKDGYAFVDYATGEQAVIEAVAGRHMLGHHGYLATNRHMDALFLAVGPGIKRGHRIGRFENIDLAPTIARVLGVELPHPDGKVLSEILSSDP
jgi:predicted AlkP superfamily pyrophosphatase or phosphodiesterase